MHELTFRYIDVVDKRENLIILSEEREPVGS